MRAGDGGQREEFDLRNQLIAIGWEEVGDLDQYPTREDLLTALRQAQPGASNGRLQNHAGQIDNFRRGIKAGSRILLPLKNRPQIAYGRVTGEYRYDSSAKTPSDCRHQRQVTWEGEFPRDLLDADLNYSINSALTVFQISRNDAEARIEAVIRNRRSSSSKPPAPADDSTVVEPAVNWEQQAIDEIRRAIIRRFKGHEMQDLVAGILQARGWTTHVVPKGPDGGKDIFASRGELGLGSPSMIVQVKSQDSPVTAPDVRQIQHAMTATKAEFGLYVAWGGYARGVVEEFRNDWFRIKLWKADDLIRELLSVYDDLPETLQLQLPLKQYWALLDEDGAI